MTKKYEHSRKFFKKKGLINLQKLSKPYSIRFTRNNETYLKAQLNREKFVNSLITEHRMKEKEKENELIKWRGVLYPSR